MPAKVDNQVILQAKAISKAFGGIQALEDVSLEIHTGKINAIVGENGAGKSTLMKIFSGVYQEYQGRIHLDDQGVAFAHPREAQDKGIAIIHQELNLIPYLTVAENIFLGREFLNSFGLIDYKRMNRETKVLLNKLNLHIEPDILVSDLRVGQQQIVEIAKALSMEARVIIMDEPTSAISEQEIKVLFGLIRSLKERGVAIVYITHKLDELFQIADWITVLRDGRLIQSRPLTGLTEDDIVRMMVGRDIQDFFVKTQAAQPQERFRVEELCLSHPERTGDYIVDHVSFRVNQGEVLGIFGLMGAGRTELLETVFGLHSHRCSGRIFLDNREILINCPASAIRLGIVLIPEDRKREGLIMEMSVRSSISLASIKQTERWGFISAPREKKLAYEYTDRLHIKTASDLQKVESLSGGNQQKIVIAKWLATRPKVMLLDEPTRGIDVGAKNEIYKLISELTAAGMSIVVVSSELPEILAISDRIMVISEGRQTGEFIPSQATEEIILRAALPKSA